MIWHLKKHSFLTLFERDHDSDQIFKAQVVQDQVGCLAEALPSVAEQADGVPHQGPKEGHRESAAVAAAAFLDGMVMVNSGE